MILRELLVSAIEHGYLDEPVTLHTWNSDGEYVEFEVTEFNSDMRTGSPRQQIQIRQRSV